MNRTEASKLVTIALAARPTPASFLDGQAIADMGAAWHLILADVPYQAAEAALAVVLAGEASTGKIPGPDLVRRTLTDAAFGERRPGGEAWGDVRKLHSRFSVHRYPKSTDVDDPIVWRCIQALGWVQICNSENPTADRARFIELYDRLSRTSSEARNVATLPAAQRLASMAGELARQLGVGEPDRRALNDAPKKQFQLAGESANVGEP